MRKKIFYPDGDLLLRGVAAAPAGRPGQELPIDWGTSLMDPAATVAAEVRTRGLVRRESVMSFEAAQRPCHGDVVCLYTSITRIGRTSIAVGVAVYALRRFLEERVRLATADYVLVALDDLGLPRVLSTAA